MTDHELRIEIEVDQVDTDGESRALTLGVPLPRGILFPDDEARLVLQTASCIPGQAMPTVTFSAAPTIAGAPSITPADAAAVPFRTSRRGTAVRSSAARSARPT